MNVIGNNCTSAQLYKISNKEFDNPFMWVIITSGEFLKLIKNFHKINFRNRKLIKTRIPTVKHREVAAILIDDLVTVTFPHHVKDEKYNKPTVCKSDFTGWDVRYKYIGGYLLEKYDKRIERMLKNNEPPTFLLDTSLSNDNDSYEFEIVSGNFKKIMCIFNGNYTPKTDIESIVTGKEGTASRAQKIISKYGKQLGFTQ